MSLSYTGWTPQVFHGAEMASSRVSGGATMPTGQVNARGSSNPASATGVPVGLDGNPIPFSQPSIIPTTTTPGGSVNPNDPTNTLANLQTANGTPNDPKLASRQFVNPLTGNRDVAAAQSVYGNSNVPAYLASAVNSLNQEQLSRKIALTNFQNELLNRYDYGGPGQYEIANVLQALAVQPGAHFSTTTIADPNLGLGYKTQSDAAASLNSQKANSVNQDNQNQTQIAHLQAQRDQAQRVGLPTYDLDNQILNLQVQPNSVATAAAGSNPGKGWVPFPGNSF